MIWNPRSGGGKALTAKLAEEAHARGIEVHAWLNPYRAKADDGSTAVTLYTGNFNPDGKSATVKASIINASTGKPTPLELRMSLGANGGHVTQLWGMGLGTKMFKMMELQYTRTKP